MVVCSVMSRFVLRLSSFYFFFQAEDGIRDADVTGVQTCALPICNRIHYIDEGSGPILFFLHPGIGWSFMYRDIIKELRSRFRCVAPDLPGFGLSSAAPGYVHTLTGDSLLIERVIHALGLVDIALFADD